MYRVLLIICFCSYSFCVSGGIGKTIISKSITIYVAESGSDTNAGLSRDIKSITGPVQSVSQAILKARAIGRLRRIDTIAIKFLGAFYTLYEPIRIDNSVNDIGNAVILFTSDSSQRTSLFGSIEFSDASELRQIVYSSKFPVIFNDGRLAVNTTFPTNSYLFYNEISSIDANGKKYCMKLNESTFDTVKQAIKLKSKEAVRLNIYSNWEFASVYIDSIDDVNRSIYFKSPRGFSNDALKLHDNRFQLVLNKDSFSTYDPANMKYDQVSSDKIFYNPINEAGITITGENIGNPVKNIIFRNLSFECFGYDNKLESIIPLQSAAGSTSFISLTYSENITFDNCFFNGIAKTVLWCTRGNSRISIRNSIFKELGEGAIKVGVIGLEQNQINKYVDISGNQMSNGGLLNSQAAALLVINGANISIRSNNIRYFFHSGIALGWGWGVKRNFANDIEVENNVVANLGMYKMNDFGGIYTNGMFQRVLVKGNLVSSLHHYTYGAVGIYLDEGSSNITVCNNSTYDTDRAGFLFSNGSNNTIKGNIFAISKSETIQFLKFKNVSSTFLFFNNVVYNNKAIPLTKNFGFLGVTSYGNFFWDTILKRDTKIDGNFNMLYWKSKIDKGRSSQIVDPLLNRNFSSGQTILSNSLLKGVTSTCL